jgi:hypothetical protein
MTTGMGLHARSYFVDTLGLELQKTYKIQIAYCEGTIADYPQYYKQENSISIKRSV